MGSGYCRRRRQSTTNSPDKIELVMSSNKAAAEDDKKPANKPNGTLVEKEKEQVGKVDARLVTTVR